MARWPSDRRDRAGGAPARRRSRPFQLAVRIATMEARHSSFVWAIPLLALLFIYDPFRTAAGYNPRAGVYLVGGILPVVRNVLGMTGIGVILCLVTGAQIAWIGPLAFTAISQFAVVANYSEPLTWPTRPPTDRGGWIAALVVFAVGLIAFTVRGPRVRLSGELRRQ